MDIRIITENAVCYDEHIYAFAQNINLLIRMNEEKTEVVGSMPEELFFEGYLVGGMVCVRDMIYLIPHRAKSMWIYNISKGIWEKCNLKSIYPNMDRKFNAVYKYENSIYMIGFRYPGILAYNLETGEEINYNVFDEVIDRDSLVEGYVRKDCYFDGQYLYAPLLFTNIVLKFNILSQKWRLMNVEGCSFGFSGICFDGENYILSPSYHGDRVIAWNEKEGITGNWGIGGDKGVYIGVLKLDNNVIVLGKVGTRSLLIEGEKAERLEKSYYAFSKNAEEAFFQDEYGCYTELISGEITRKKMVNISLDAKYVTDISNEYPILVENGFEINLKSYLEIIKCV